MVDFNETAFGVRVSGIINRKGQVAIDSVGNHSFTAALFSRMSAKELAAYDVARELKERSYQQPFTAAQAAAFLGGDR